MSDSLKIRIINEIIKVEGGYVNDPRDSGGETNWGITKRVARSYGYYGAMRSLPRQTAFNIYEKRYLEPIMFDEIAGQSELIAEELADTAVNMGVRRAGEFLQRALNSLNNQGRYYDDLKVDGDIGPATFRALVMYMQKRGKSAGEQVMCKALNCLQGEFYISLAERRQKDETFVWGWLKNRVS